MSRRETAKGTIRPKKAEVTTSMVERLALGASGLALAIVVAEIAVRVMVPPPPRARMTDPAGYPPVDNIDELYVYGAGVRWAHIYDVAAFPREYLGPSGRITYRTNNLGLRGKDVDPAKAFGIRRILCLGDSITFGEGVREEDTWPEQLGHRLGPRVEVVNAGIQGYDFNHEALYLLLYGRRMSPDVVVMGFFMNDAMPFRATVEHHDLATEISEPDSWMEGVSALWSLFAGRRRALEKSERYLGEIRDSFRSENWRGVKGRMPKVREMGNAEGFPVVAVVFPLLYRLDEYPLAAEHAEVIGAFSAAGIEVVDLLPDLQAMDAQALWVHPIDPHPNEIVHRIAAERLARLPVMQGTEAQ